MNNKGLKNGEQRRVRSIKKRSQKAEALKEEVLKLKEECPGLSQRDMALMLGISPMTGRKKTRENRVYLILQMLHDYRI